MADKDNSRREDAEMVAGNVVMPLNLVADRLLHDTPEIVEIMERQLGDMENHQQTMAAWPTPETMQKADEMQADNEMFEAMIKLLKTRKTQLETRAHGGNGTVGAAILKQWDSEVE